MEKREGEKEGSGGEAAMALADGARWPAIAQTAARSPVVGWRSKQMRNGEKRTESGKKKWVGGNRM